ncbi:MAG: VWA domain-containing protein [Candidatus Altiarchaeota archaeon]
MRKITILAVLVVSLIVTQATYGLATEVFPKMVRPQLDVVFVLDSTGSMSDEILAVKAHIKNIVSEIQQGRPTPDLRIGIVTYRDHLEQEKQYVYKKFDLTSDIDSVLDDLRGISAQGGGDSPEAVVDGLHIAIKKMEWRQQAKKMIFLIGDAAPHGVGSSDRSYEQGCPEGYTVEGEIEAAIDEGVVIYTISGSGIDSHGIREFKKIAAETDGEYEALTYRRREAESYYTEKHVDAEFAAPEADSTYKMVEGKATILTNNLADFAVGALKKEAMAMGVEYDGEEVKKTTTSTVKPTSPIDPGTKEIDIHKPDPTTPTTTLKTNMPKITTEDLNQENAPPVIWIFGGLLFSTGLIIIVSKR